MDSTHIMLIPLCLLIAVLSHQLSAAESCRFGVGCPLQCHCKNDVPCDPWTGECPDGCAQDGDFQWTGQACQTGNLALGKATAQSRTALLVKPPTDDPSTDIPLSGSRAVDGDTNTDVSEPPYCARSYAPGLVETWWLVNLAQESTIYSVTIYTGDDCCSAGNALFVKAGDSRTSFPRSCGSSSSATTNADGSITTTCGSSGVTGSYVKVHRKRDTRSLTLCEVIVEGSKFIDCSECPAGTPCDSIVGCDECIGTKLPDCKEVCDFGTYGVNCESSCGQCSGGADCDKTTGRCDNCDTWTIGTMCETPIDAVDLGETQLETDVVTSDAIEVTWPQVQVPLDARSHYTYRLQYKPEDSDTWLDEPPLPLGTGSTVRHTVDGLQYNFNYEFQMWVTRQIGALQEDGQPTDKLTEKTLCLVPETPTKPDVEAAASGTGTMNLNVTWEDVSGLDSGCDSLDKVQILYSPDNVRSSSTEDVQFDQYDVTLYDLQPRFYNVHLMVTNNEGLSSISDKAVYEIPNIPQKVSTGDGDDDSDLAVIGICVAAGLLLLLVFAGLMTYWSVRNWSPTGRNRKDIEEAPYAMVVPLPPQLDNYPTDDGLTIEDDTLDAAVPSDTENTFIPVPEFADYVQTGLFDGNDIRVQFMGLPSELRNDVTAGSQPANLSKNRFKNIFPYDRSRVVLESLDDVPDSDYINASYMNGYKDKLKYYVAMQGPLPNTIDDTWRAVWQLCANTVVMVTSLQEGENIKCEKYWPDKGVEQTYGDNRVRTLEEDVFAHHTVRKLRVINDGVKRTVRHFHFTDWPDTGTPDHVYPLLHFREAVRSFDHLATGPMVVHCTAGAGRTGIFIALDYLLEQAKEENGVDVFGCLKAMRVNRPQMGGNVKQYVFLHMTLNEAFLYGDTAIPLSRLAQSYSELMHDAAGEDGNTSKLADQFASVEKLTPGNTETEPAGLSPENMDKNRHNALIPIDARRPLLSPRPGTDSDYINAVFVTNYRSKKGFIVTQTPLPNTVNDFWRLVSDYNICSIVMMHENMDDEDTAPIYWPQAVGKPTEFGSLEVTLHGQTASPKQGFIEREFNLSQDENLDLSNQFVKQWELLGWFKDDDLPDYLSTTLLSILESVNKWQAEALSQGPVLVHCMDGATRSGLPCAASYLLEMAKAEKKVDVFNVVRDIRTSRTQLISTLDQYQFLHEVVLEHSAVDELESAAF